MNTREKLAVVGALGLAGLAFYAGARRAELMTHVTPNSSALDLDASGNGRAVLNRMWFDRLPTSSKEEHTLWLFLAGGLGIQMAGSDVRWTTEIFDLERANNRLALASLQDDKPTNVTFEVKACDEKPPFDLCLRFNEPLRGVQVLYGFGTEDDAATRYGWFRQMRERAHAEATRASNASAAAPKTP